MSCVRRLLIVLLGIIVLVGCEQSETGNQSANTDKVGLPVGRGFDFYLLALSWSPSYCAAEGKRANQQQCDTGRPYGFIVHGLWPQFNSGYPEYCVKNASRVNRKIEQGMRDIMPSNGLIRHQWKKHGTCTSLTQDQYFETTRAARERITIPPGLQNTGVYKRVSPAQIKSAFLQANPQMKADGVAVTCDRQRLREIRICMTMNLEYRSCPKLAGRGCKLNKVAMPPRRES